MAERIFKNEWPLRVLSYIGLALISLLMLGAVLNIGYGLDNLNLIFCFETDEARLVERVTANLANGDLNPRGHYNYGYLYETVAVGVASIFKFFEFNIDPRFIGSLLRLESLISCSIVLLLVYHLCIFLGASSFWGITAGLFLIIFPDYYYWAQAMHPDILQSVLIVAAFYFAIKLDGLKALLISSALCGLSFGTKYSGIFALPFLFIPFFAQCFSTTTKYDLSFIKKVTFGLLVLFGIFTLSYLISNSYVLQFAGEAWGDFNYERNHVAVGDEKLESANGFLWFPILYSQLQFSVSFWLLLGFVLSAVGLIWRARSTGTIKEFLADRKAVAWFTLLAYCLVSFIYLFVFVRMRVPRFTFHFLPIFYAAAFSAIGIFSNRLSPKARISLCIVVLISATSSISLAMKYTKFLSHKSLSPLLTSGEFLLKFDPTTRILSDHYSYVPPRFINVEKTWGVDHEKISLFNPDLIILTHGTTGRWAWPKEKSSFNDRQFDINTAYGEKSILVKSFLDQLFSPGSSWSLIYEDSDVAILERKKVSK
ncbi:MAG: hypothetical protein SGJ02_13485 [bacterium]|nr:hypothetical protein [bacterium]